MRRLLLVLATVAVLATGCGDDDDAPGAADASTDTSTETSTTERVTAGSAASEADVVAVDFAFEPATIEVAAGDTVTWANEDGVAHTVTAGTPDAPDDAFAQTLDPGATVDIGFDEPGTYPYYCAIHPSMTGEVAVG